MGKLGAADAIFMICRGIMNCYFNYLEDTMYSARGFLYFLEECIGKFVHLFFILCVQTCAQ